MRAGIAFVFGGSVPAGKKTYDGTISDGQARQDIPIQGLTDASSTTDLSAAPKRAAEFSPNVHRYFADWRAASSITAATFSG